MEDQDESLQQPKRVSTKNNYQVSISGEDHTLLNVLRYTIDKRCTDVELCGYTIPHPSEDVAVFRVQLKDEGVQSADGVYKTMVVGLDCVAEISDKLAEEIDAWGLA